ncbi:hypothetical protein MMC29_002150 [Sticta canariensis]|nr:hypothetical protein [Sticta canariensis]
MQYAIIQTDLLFETIRHAILYKPTDLLVANYPAQSAQQEATVMETPDLLIVVAAPIQIGPRRIVQKTGSFSNIYPCTAGFWTTEFCCGDVAGAPGASECCSNKLSFAWGDPFAPSQDDTSTSTVSVLSTSTSSSTQISSSIGSSTNSALSGTSASSLSAHTSSKNSTAIGVGIGVPLGLLLLLGLGFLVYRERQRQTMMKSLQREKEAALSNMWQGQPHNEYPLVSNTILSHELEHTQKPPGELESRSIYEAAAKPWNGI